MIPGDSIRLSAEEADDLRRRIALALREIGQQLLQTTDEPSPDAIDRTGAMLEPYAELLRVAGGEEISEELVEQIANRDLDVLAGSEALRRLETWGDE